MVTQLWFQELKDKRSYRLQVGATIMVNEGDEVEVGDVISKVLVKRRKQKILQGVFQELLNFLKQESQLMLLKFLMFQEQLNLVQKLEVVEELLLSLKMDLSQL